MDKTLLKKAAIQSVALMLAVVTSAYALKQYQTVTIKAVSNYAEAATNDDTDSLDTTDAIDTEQQDTEPVIELTEVEKHFSGADQNILKQLGDNYLVIKKPEGEQLSLLLKDVYIKKSIQLTITGMVTEDLSSDMISRVKGEELFSGDPAYTETITTETDEDGNSKEVVTRDFGNDLSHGIIITTMPMDGTKQFSTEILIELDSVYVYTIYEDSVFYYINLQKPSDVYDKILVIDAGHGGKDGGASSKNGRYLEKNLNLDILLELKALLDKENIKVYYTRTGDDSVYLRPRVELGNAVDCDYFVSIHCNSNNVSSPNGSEVLYYDNKFKGVKNVSLAKLFSKELGDVIPLKNKGTVERHYEDLYIMDKAKIPMILIEVGYLSNSNDLNYLIKKDSRKSIALGIYNGIMKAYKELPVNRLTK